MRDVFFKPSQQIESFFPDNSSIDSENFTEFLNAYYEWLQTTRIVVTNITGTFQKNETLVGQTSGANAIIREVGEDYLILQVQSRLRFAIFETIVGNTSSANAIIESVKDNVIRATGNLLEYRDIDKSIDDYADYLREELFPTIPVKYIRDEKLIASQLKTFFSSRSNEESYRFFFKLLYNEEIEFRFPGEEILRASDGKFEKTNFIRVVSVANIFEFINKTIRGETSGAFGTVVDIKQFFFGSTEIAEFTLKLVSGTFAQNETVVDVLDPSVATTTFGMITGFNIVDGGSGYTQGDVITISGDGTDAAAVVSSVSQASISALTINEIGHGYRINTQAVINNAGTGGANLAIQVTGITNTYSVTDGSNTFTVGEISELSIRNRGENYFRSPIITIEDSTIAALGLLSDRLIQIADAGIDFGVGNTLIFTGGSGANAAGQVASVVESISYDFLLEDGSKIIIDSSLEDILKDEDWDVLGPIRRIELTNFGDGYTTNDLPVISVNTTTGSGANLIATNIQGRNADVSVDTANNSVGVGAIRAIQINNPGLNYTTATANAALSGDGNANLIPIITGLLIKDGEFLNDDGKIGIRVLIDSFFFQEFSYVIKSGLPFNVYRDELKKIIHPAGLQPFGEILVTSSIVSPANVISKRKIIVESDFDVSLDMMSQVQYIESSVITVFIESKFDAYAIRYKDITIAEFEDDEISTLSNEKFNDIFKNPNVKSLITKFKQIQGTVSSDANTQYQDYLLSDYENASIAALADHAFSDTVSLLLGNTTIFTSDFVIGDVLLANGELFTVDHLFNDTQLEIDRLPVSAFADVFAYKVIS